MNQFVTDREIRVHAFDSSVWVSITVHPLLLHVVTVICLLSDCQPLMGAVPLQSAPLVCDSALGGSACLNVLGWDVFLQVSSTDLHRPLGRHALRLIIIGLTCYRTGKAPIDIDMVFIAVVGDHNLQ